MNNIYFPLRIAIDSWLYLTGGCDARVRTLYRSHNNQRQLLQQPKSSIHARTQQWTRSGRDLIVHVDNLLLQATVIYKSILYYPITIFILC